MNRSTMPAALKEKWLADLRSGNYKQAQGALKGPAKDGSGATGYCCLGMLQISAGDKDVEMIPGGYRPETLPSHDWLERHSCYFIGDPDDSKLHSLQNTPWLPTIGMYASQANDDGNLSFEAIADAIEKDIDGV